jgi:hypothetical protein
MNELQELEQEILKNVSKNNKNKTVELLLVAFEKLNVDLFTDLLANALKSEGGKEISKEFLGLIQNTPELSKLYAMEKHFIEKHLLVEGERLVTSFFGTLESNIEYVDGRIFVTNYRIVAAGSRKPLENGSTLIFKPAGESLGKTIWGKGRGLPGLEDRMIMKRTAKRILKEIRKSLNLGFYSLNHMQYGSYYPFGRPSKIQVSLQSIEFLLNVLYIVPFIESRSDHIFVKIKRVKGANESESEFQDKTVDAYSIIQDTLTSRALQENLHVAIMASVSDIGTYLGKFFWANKGKAWTLNAIYKRVNELGLPNKIAKKMTPSKLQESINRLVEVRFIKQNEHEGNAFYFL